MDRLYDGNGAEDGRERSGGWEDAERLYEGSGVVDGRKRSVCLVPSEKSL